MNRGPLILRSALPDRPSLVPGTNPHKSVLTKQACRNNLRCQKSNDWNASAIDARTQLSIATKEGAKRHEQDKQG